MAQAPSEFISPLFRTWRHLLTATVRWISCKWTRLGLAVARRADEWRTVREYLTDTAGVWADGSSARLLPAAAFGLRALAAGLIISTGLALSSGSHAPAAGLMVLVELLWTAARLAIVLLVLPASTPRPRALIAFSAGLAPYAAGITPLLRLVALLLSGILTARGLRGAGVATRQARAAIAWAFGGQALIVAGSALIRGAIALMGAL